MSNSIDQKIISFKLDDEDLQAGVKRVLLALSNVEKASKLKGASDGFSELENDSDKITFKGILSSLTGLSKKFGALSDDAASSMGDIDKSADEAGLNIDGLADNVSSVRNKFSALSIVGATALVNIANQAINTGKQLVASFTTAPISSGFSQYQSKIQAVMMLETSLGKSQSQVINDSINKVDKYAQLTIYNVNDMTQALSQMVNQGIKIDDATTALEGMGNVAASAGVDTVRFNSVMQTAIVQAMAMGKMNLQNWRQIEEAGMATTQFKNALVSTAKAMGQNVDLSNGFDDSLQTGWMTTKVMTKTLSEMASNKALLDMAQQFHTFSSVSDAAAEGMTNAWSKFFESMIGGVDQATDLWTPFGNAIMDVETVYQDYLVSVGTSFNKLGGMKLLVDTVSTSFHNLSNILSNINDAWTQTFHPDTAKSMVNVLSAIHNFTLAITLSSHQLSELHEIVKNFLAPLKLIEDGIRSIESVMPNAGSVAKSSISVILDVLLELSRVILVATELTRDLFNAFNKETNIISDLHKALSGLSNIISDLSKGFDGLVGNAKDISLLAAVFVKFGKIVGEVYDRIISVGKKVFDWIHSNISLGDIINGLVGASAVVGIVQIYKTFKSIGELIDKVKGALDSGGKTMSAFKEGASAFTDVLKEVQASLKAFTQGIKAATLLEIAFAVTLLVESIKTLSKLNVGQVSTSLIALAVLFKILQGSLKSMIASLDSMVIKRGLFSASVLLISVAYAANELVSAMVKMKDLNPGQISQGLLTLKLMLMSLSSFIKKSGVADSGIRTSIELVAIAQSISMLTGSITKISSLSLDNLEKGIGGLGAVLLELSIAMKLIGSSKVSLRDSVALLAIAQTLVLVSGALSKIGKLSWDQIEIGLAGMGGALAELSIVMAILSKVGGFRSLLGSASILVAVQSLAFISNGLMRIGNLSWNQIERGLSGIGAALLELGSIISIIGKIDPGGALVSSIAIVAISYSLQNIANELYVVGNLSWDKIAKGLTGLGAALLELGATVTIIGEVSPGASILGAASIVIIVSALDKISGSLKSIGQLSWTQIARGLAGIGGALTELGLVTSLIGTFAPGTSILGAASIVLVSLALDKIADPLAKIGKLSWSQIAKGLVGLGGALTELGLIVSAIGTMGGLQSLIGSASIFIAVQSLSSLADGLKKLGSLSWTTIQHGLSAMNGAFASIAIGSFFNTLSFLGASSLKSVSSSIGTLADSMNKWAKVKMPSNLVSDMDQLAKGVGKFAFTWGSGNLSKAAPALGSLADAITKWEGIVVPDDLGENLKTLAKGISAFDWNAIAGLSLSAISGPFGDFADSVSKWSKVKFQDNLGDNLKDLEKGISSFDWTFLSGMNLSSIVGPFGDLAVSVNKWKNVKVPKGIGDELQDLEKGISSFDWEFFSGLNIGNITGPFGDLADSVLKWKNVKIQSGLGSGLKSLGEGFKSFNWQLFTGMNLKAIVTPFGDLADSVNKWKNVKLPVGIGKELTSLHDGIKVFDWAQMAGWGLSSIVKPFGDLASSIIKWKNVTVPKNIGKELESLHDGISKFSWSQMAGWGLDKVAGPFGTLASSVVKWKNVSVPKNLGSQLSTLADGVNEFTQSSNASTAISAVAGPLGILASSVNKWKNVTIPKKLNSDLSSLADGIKSFDWKWLAGQGLSAVAGPFGTLASSVSKWKNVSVPKNIKTELKSLADGLSSFNWKFFTGMNLGNITGPLASLATSINKWKNVKVPADIGTMMSKVANGIGAFKGKNLPAQEMQTSSEGLTALSSSLNKLKSINVTSIVAKIKSLSSGLSGYNFQPLLGFKSNINKVGDLGLKAFANKISASSGSLISAFNNINKKINGALSSMSSSISNGSSSLKKSSSSIANSVKNGFSELAAIVAADGASASSHMSGVVNAFNKYADKFAPIMSQMNSTIGRGLVTISTNINSYIGTYTNEGSNLAKGLENGMKSSDSAISKAFDPGIRGAIDNTRSFYNAFSEAGDYLDEGFANGIKNNSYKAISEAYNLGAQAIAAAKKATDEHSPSRETYKIGDYFVQGAANGIAENASKVETESFKMGSRMVKTIKESVETARELMNSDDYSSPKISPIIDLSNVRSGVSDIFSKTRTFTSNLDMNIPDLDYVDSKAKKLASYQSETIKSNDKLSEYLKGLREDMSDYNDNISKMQLQLNISGKEIAKATVKDMNKELAQQSKRGKLG